MDFASNIFSTFWNKRNAKTAGADYDYAPTYGAFTPTYYFKVYRAPRTNQEAQDLYNHTRTVAWYMDALPFATSSGLPFKLGIDDIISLIPVWGDAIGFFLSLYQVFLAFLFGVPQSILVRMVINAVADFVIGIIPLVGDFMDVIFKSNLRNLDLLEEWLVKEATQYQISIPPSDTFLPRVKKGTGTWNKAAGDADPRDKYRNPPRTTRLRPADLD